MGGYENITKTKRWSQLARSLRYKDATSARIIRTHYENLLYPYLLLESGVTAQSPIKNDIEQIISQSDDEQLVSLNSSNQLTNKTNNKNLKNKKTTNASSKGKKKTSKGEQETEENI